MSKMGSFAKNVLNSPSSRFSNITTLDANPNRAVFIAVDAVVGNCPVAVKCRSCSSDNSEHMLRQAAVLRQLSHRNIAIVHDAFAAEVVGDACDSVKRWNIYIVQELLDADLRSLIASGQVTVGHCQLFSYQILCALEYAHSLGIVHFGLKPSNVLVTCQNLNIKITDFGLSRVVTTTRDDIDDHYPRWFHAPELLMGLGDLTSAVDIWAAGCIIAEMLVGHPLFRGASEVDQLLKLIDAVHLSDDDWTHVLRVMPNKLLKNHPFRPRSPLRTQLAALDRQVVHLLEMMLMFNSSERLTAAEALSHVYFSDVRHTDIEDRSPSQGSLSDNSQVKESVNAGSILAAHSGCGCYPSTDGAGCRTSPELLVPDTVSGGHDKTSGSKTASRVTEEIALKNYRNYHTRVASPTALSTDRTPSPNILDLLDGSGGRKERTVKQKRELSESDGEKEVAEISDEKLREDLEVGNVSVELLRRLCDDVVTGQVILPAVASDWDASNATAELPSTPSNMIPEISLAKLLQDSSPEPNALMLDKLEVAAVASCPGSKSKNCLDKPFRESQESDDKSTKADFAAGHQSEAKRASLSPDYQNEDSNKRNCGGAGGDFEKHKSICCPVAVEESDAVATSVSRKLILDKIETEKRRGRHRRSGSGAQITDLTSEEFDELYRLPTEHLQKDQQTNTTERSRPTVVADRSHHRHRHHSHDSFHSAGARYAHADEDRSFRDVEGACGGIDYYDDMAMSHTPPGDFDPEPATPSLYVRPVDLSSAFGALSIEDWTHGDRSFSRRGHIVGRDTSSSPESPASPHLAYTGARPKKSPKKHRAV